MDENFRDALRKEYCPPLEDATFYAIFDEYQDQFDLTNREHFASIRSILDSLKVSASAEDTVDFDPSGTGGISANGNSHGLTDTTSSSERASTPYDVQTLSTSFSELVVGEGAEGHSAYETNWNNFSREQREACLAEIFPSMDEVTISNTVRNSKGDLNFCMETLLNLSFMAKDDTDSANKEPILKKGVDGFADEGLSLRGRKRKGKRKGFTSDSTRSSSAASTTDGTSTPVRNAWLSTDEDVKFIVNRTTLQERTVRSMYHDARTSLPLTIQKIAAQESKKIGSLEKLSSTMQIEIMRLSTEFSTIPGEDLAGILSVSRNTTSAPRELAQEMIKTQASANVAQTEIVPQYMKPDLSSEDKTAARASPMSPASGTYVDRIQAMNQAIAHGLAGQAAFAQASAATKRGKSDHLMNAAAVIYAEKGHGHKTRQRELESAVASTHVAQQSTHNMTDLHGVRVHDAVRIAKERTLQWWDGLGDAKFIGDGGLAKDGFRIVTGLGHHSKDGAPRIGPAVWKALVNEGWKASVESGEILVTGRKRR